jgi:hypothetical protein
MYNVIQRCRKCETWIKREIDFNAMRQEKPSMTVKKLEAKHPELNRDIQVNEDPIGATNRRVKESEGIKTDNDINTGHSSPEHGSKDL